MISRFVSVFVIGLLLTSRGSAINVNNLLLAMRDYAFFYEYEQTTAATGSVTTYSSSNLPDYLQNAQHGNSRSTEDLASSSAYVVDTALLVNAETSTDLLYEGATDFNEFINIATNFTCQAPVDCSEVSNADIYRTVSATCNNWDNPNWGEAFTAQERFEARGSWERTALVDYNLTIDQVMFDTFGIGVKPKFDERPFLIKATGNAALRLSVYSSSNGNRVDEDFTCTDDGTNCYGIVPGAIDKIFRNGPCRVNQEIFFKEDSNVFEVIDEPNTDCKSRTYTVRYRKYNADVLIQPSTSTDDSTLEFEGSTDTDSSSDHKIDATDVTYYWVFIGVNGRFNVSSGTEYSRNEVFLSGNIGNASSFNLNSMRVAVGMLDDSGSGSLSTQFVLRDTYEVHTDDAESPIGDYGNVVDLDAVPWVYDYYTLRFGVDISNNRNFSVTLVGENDESVTLQVRFNSPEFGSFTYTGNSNAAVANFSQIDNIDYRTVAGERYNRHDAYWFAWYENFVYFGVGNQIAVNTISTQALELNDVTTFTPVRVVLYSEDPAEWVFDIEQVNYPRVSSLATGEPLASALSIAQLLHFKDAATEFSQEVTLAAFQWGQFVDHDFIATPTASVEDGESPMCCTDGQFVSEELYSEKFCFPIDVVEDVLDSSELSPFNATAHECQNFVRSAFIIDCDNNTDFRRRQQMNIITSYIDGSNVYGSTDDELKSLRTEGGNGTHMYIQTNVFTDGQELPKATEGGEGCAVEGVTNEYTINGNTQSVTINCNHAGDFRSQEQPMLAGIHTLFVREHNRLVDKFLEEGIYTNDTDEEKETLFQVVRHIVIAEMQKITYQDFLPSFMSDATINKYKLNSGCRYRRKTKAAMRNLFGIVFRMGHTWIPNDLAGDLSEDVIAHAQDSVPLIHNFFNATQAYTNGSGSVLINMKKSCPLTDRLMETVPLHFLFGNLDGVLTDTAMNLAALNNQRARDHGVPTYKDIRDEFKNDGDVIPESIDDMLELGIVDSEAHGLLKRAYQSIEDIDAFTAAIVENPQDTTSSVGAVINEVLGEMFQILKQGDRFWYDCYYRSAAAAEIEKVTLGKIMCDNVNNFDAEDSQIDLFRVESSSDNPTISCANRDSMDLSKFSANLLGGRRNNFGNNLDRRGLELEDVDEELQLDLEVEMKELMQELEKVLGEN